jgi:hypothetical protein
MTKMMAIAFVALFASEAYAMPPSSYGTFNAGNARYIIINANSNDTQTLPQAINNHSEISGDFIAENKVSSAFVRDAHGDMGYYGTLGGGSKPGQGSFAVSIASNGDIAGYIIDRKGFYHGFIQSQDDDYDFPVDVPGGKNTKLTCMGLDGSSVGTVELLKGTKAGFYRDTLGDITVFFVNGSPETIPLSVNEHEMVAGLYLSSGIHDGFLRDRFGDENTFQVFAPGSQVPQDIRNLQINSDGAVAGTYTSSSGVDHGFSRAQNGAPAIFDVVGAGVRRGQGTVATSIDNRGNIAGYYIAGGGVAHGFLRMANGATQTFEVPGASNTYVTAMDSKLDVVGYYTDSKNRIHGFLRKP